MSSFVFPPPPPAALKVAGGGLFPVRRIFCIGRNYAEHAREMGGNPVKEPPFFFSKPADAVTQAEKIPYPAATADLHYEGELVVALTAGGRDISPLRAPDHIFGYAAGCDLTRRDLQAEAKKNGRPWDMAKGFDYSATIGPILPAAMAPSLDKGMIATRINGELRQCGDLSDMIWPLPEIIASLSRLVALAPGDLIYSGTPAGVGALGIGDQVEISIEGIGANRFSII